MGFGYRLYPSYAGLAVTSLSVAPFRFHSPYSAIMSSFHRTPKLTGAPLFGASEWSAV